MDKTPVSDLVVFGLAQVALGALVGFPYAIATYRPDLPSTLGGGHPAESGSCTSTSS
jgi:hypothetical protein